MALVDINFFSYTLGMDTSMKVLLPEKRGAEPVLQMDKKYPVLYLLHGHGDDQTAWIRKSNIELLVRDYDLIVVMPTTHRGFYTNGKHGPRYFDFFTKELPTVVSNFFPASNRREDTYVAGLSMGGYGAYKLALSCPDLYAGAASMSGGLYPLGVLEAGTAMFSVPDFVDNALNFFGNQEEYVNSQDDLEYLIEQLDKKDVPKPKLFQSCGLQDPLYKANSKFRDYINNNTTTFKYVYEESEGAHNWDFWNKDLPKLIRYFGLIK
jgi:Predicted esterase